MRQHNRRSHRRYGLRVGLVAVLAIAAYWGSPYQFPPLAPPQTALAQPAPVQTAPAVATPTATDSPTATAVPTAPAPTATDAAPTPTDAASATSTDVDPTSTVSATQSPTATPSPDPTLPTLTLQQDAPGVSAETTIGTAGGRISSADGRVNVTFPAGATSSALSVKITRQPDADVPPPTADTPFVGRWQFDAALASGTSVHLFNQNLTIQLHFGGMDLIGRNPDTLAFWTFDEASQQWLRLASTWDPGQQVLTILVNHFSSDAATADNIAESAPLLNGNNVEPHSGTSSFSVPIDLPPGPGGLAPQLNLSYDSGRLQGMRQYSSTSSWAGLGWDLDMGSVQLANTFPGYYLPDTSFDAGGLGGDLYQSGLTDTSGGQFNGDPIYYTRDQQFARVRTDCSSHIAPDGGLFYVSACSWWITTKAGVTYRFGGDDAHSRWYMFYYSVDTQAPWMRDYYRFDLNSVTDASGNTINYTYSQQFYSDKSCTNAGNSGAYCQYVMSSYPTKITYDGPPNTGLAEVDFAFHCPNANVPSQVVTTTICERPDSPHDVTRGGCGTAYLAPKVMETQQLDNVTVKLSGQTVRSYVFNYTDTNFSTNNTPCPPTPQEGGEHRLTSVAEKDTGGPTSPNTLYSMAFQYAAKHFRFENNPSSGIFDFNYSHLTEADNGMGGNVQFTYAEKDNGATTQHWTSEAVTQQTRNPGLGEPAMTTSYTYASGPMEYDFPSWQKQPNTAAPTNGLDPFNALFRGFGQTTETDASGNQTVHSYYTTGNDTPVPANFENEILTGREYQTVTKDSAGTTWKTVATDWQSVCVPENGDRYVPTGACYLGAPDYPPSIVNFIYPLQVATTLKDGSQTFDQSSFDVSPTYGTGTGDLLQTNSFVGTAPTSPTVLTACTSANGCTLSATTAWTNDTTDWIFVPQYQSQTDPKNANALLRCSRSYYDGGKTAGTLPASGAKGLLTASSTAITASTCDASTPFTTSTNAYTIYDGYGNAVQASVPASTPPEGQSGGGALGWIPAGVGSTSATYDSTYHAYAVQQADALGHVTDYNVGGNTFNFLFGKPQEVQQPNHDVLNYQYDTFGRLTNVFDSLDSSTYPTQTFTYTWGGIPNQTLESTRVTSGSTAVHSVLSCMDGFGREVERRETYAQPAVSIVRTDYDARGMKAVVTNPAYLGNSIGTCPSSEPAVTSYDRTTSTYDPLGNVVFTSSYAAGDTTHGTNCSAPALGIPCTETTANGLTTTSLDELNHRTVKTSNPSARTLTVEQDTGANPWTAYATTTYRYDALGQLIGVTDPQGNVTSLAYDLAGRKTSMTDPDMGHWTYGYDAAGKLTTQTDAIGVTTTLGYDGLERLQMKSYSNGDPSVLYGYDTYPDVSLCTESSFTAVGMATQMLDGAGEQLSCYDQRGRAEVSRRTLTGDPTNYDTRTAFDDLNQPIQVTYPDLDVATYTEGTSGNITGLSSQVAGGSAQTLASGATPMPFGAPFAVTLGNTLRTVYTYDSRERLTNTTTSNSTSTAQNTTLTYDDASNVKTVNNAVTAETVNYNYDDLNRLTSASGFAGGFSASYTYDTIGNMLTKNEGAQTMTLCYPAAGQLQPHAVTTDYTTAGAQCGVGTVNSTFGYQADGAMIKSGDQGNGNRGGHAFDAENRLKDVLSAPLSSTTPGFTCIDVDGDGTITSADVSAVQTAFSQGKTLATPGWSYLTDLDENGSVSASEAQRENSHLNQPCVTTRDRYTYDGNGTLLKREHLIQGSGGWTVQSSTTYIGGVYEKHQDGSVVKYYGAMGRTIAMRTVPAAGGAGTLSWPLLDHLGSTVGMTDSTGTLTGTQSYWPYGTVRTTTGVFSGPLSAPTDKLYTGQQQEAGDPALGLYNYKARFYSTVLGRFVSADTVADGLNRYAYVHDNPLRFVDPSGKCVTFFGETLACSPQDAIQILACSQSAKACADAMTARGIAFDPHMISEAMIFSKWATDIRNGAGREFWNNFLRPEINPYWNTDAVYGTFGGLIGNELLDTGSSIYTAGFNNAAILVTTQIDDYCQQVDCGSVSLDLFDLTLGLVGSDELPYFLAGLPAAVYTAEVQRAWQQYRSDPTGANYRELWSTIDSELLGLRSEDAGLAVDLVHLWIDTVCQPDPRCDSAMSGG